MLLFTHKKKILEEVVKSCCILFLNFKSSSPSITIKFSSLVLLWDCSHQWLPTMLPNSKTTFSSFLNVISLQHLTLKLWLSMALKSFLFFVLETYSLDFPFAQRRFFCLSFAGSYSFLRSLNFGNAQGSILAKL